MMNKYLNVAAAVAAALAASSAYALDPATTLAAPVQLTVAGASAQRDAFLVELSTANPAGLCASNLDVYRSTSSDFRAYSCTLKTSAQVPALGTIGGLNAAIYYRSEGGSVWGPLSLVPGAVIGGGISRLQVSASCAATTGTPVSGLPTRDCPVTGYSLTNDNVVTGLVKDNTELAVSDVEPKMFTDSNYPQSTVFAPFSAGIASSLKTLAFTTGFSQVFGVIVNSNAATSPASSSVLNLTRQDLAAIFNGNYTDWSQVPRQDNSGYYPAGAIVVCRREPGSGTQVIAAAKYLGTNCGASHGFVTDSAPGTADGVVENNTTGALETCVNTTANAIGINIFKNPAPLANIRYVSINGVAPDKIAAATGQYPIWNEMTFAKRPALATSDASANRLADTLIARSRAATSVPDTVATFAIPSGTNLPTVPVSAADPVGLATTGGNTCLPAAGI